MSAAVDDLLLRLDADERTRPVPLLDAAPLVERLVGRRPHRSALHRWHARGVAGVRLAVLRVGGARYVTPRMLAEFFAAAGEQREAPRAPSPPRRRRISTRARRTP